jgi:hypothetical protein
VLSFIVVLPTCDSSTELQTIIRIGKDIVLVLEGRCVHVRAYWL